MYATIEQANAAVIARIREAPALAGCGSGAPLDPQLAEGRKLLHAGPPVTWQEMSGPVRGACIGACLFEGWAQDEQQALALLAGEIEFIPCHSVSAVGRWAASPRPTCRWWWSGTPFTAITPTAT